MCVRLCFLTNNVFLKLNYACVHFLFRKKKKTKKTIQHVFADSMRTTAMILASILAEFSPSITPEVADASAAVVVSLLIILSLLPLFTGMVQSVRSLRGVHSELFIIQEETKKRAREMATYNDGIDTGVEGEWA